MQTEVRIGVTHAAYFKGSLLMSAWAFLEDDPSRPLRRADITLPEGTFPATTQHPTPHIQANPTCGVVGVAHGIAEEHAAEWSLALWFEEDTAPRLLRYPADCLRDYPAALFMTFVSAVNATPHASLLEIGSRARSGNVWRDQFTTLEAYLGVDVLAGPNVDLVGDAHALSSLLLGRTFDFIYTQSVFEHLLMPWKVALEMNALLKEGGLAYIGTHQTIGLHDLPWDYWRFSRDAWHGLFNDATGFEVVEAEYTHPMFIVPFYYEPHFQGIEQSAGFYGSNVLVRKRGAARERWQTTPADVIDTLYPV